MIKWILILFTFNANALEVTVDPYRNLDYEKINVYYISEECESDCIEVVGPEDEPLEPETHQHINRSIRSLFPVPYGPGFIDPFYFLR